MFASNRNRDHVNKLVLVLVEVCGHNGDSHRGDDGKGVCYT